MTIRLHLRAMRVLEVVEDLPERLVVAVVAISSVIRCRACGHETARVHAPRRVKVADLPVSGRPTTWFGTGGGSAAIGAGPRRPRAIPSWPSG